jgi:2-iminobutanoate/2-iminopropanoate deaminase
MQFTAKHDIAGRGHAGSVTAGNLIFLSGTGSQLEAGGSSVAESLEHQVTEMLDKVKEAIEKAGGSLDNLIKTTLYLENMADYIPVREAELAYYRSHAPLLEIEPPASTAVQVKSFSENKGRLGIDAIAVIRRDYPGWEVRKYTNPTYKKPFVSQFAAVGNLVFCSGMDARRPDLGRVPSNHIEDQMEVSFSKIRMCLEAAGGALNDIVRATCYIKDADLIPRLWEAENQYFRQYAPALLKNPPAGSIIPANLTNPDFLIEIEVIGMVSAEKT